MEISYNELRCKEVVNLHNGARMGKIIDMIIESNGKDVLGLVVPGVRKLFKASEDIFIPWNNISQSVASGLLGVPKTFSRIS